MPQASGKELHTNAERCKIDGNRDVAYAADASLLTGCHTAAGAEELGGTPLTDAEMSTVCWLPCCTEQVAWASSWPAANPLICTSNAVLAPGATTAFHGTTATADSDVSHATCAGAAEEFVTVSGCTATCTAEPNSWTRMHQALALSPRAWINLLCRDFSKISQTFQCIQHYNASDSLGFPCPCLP